MRSNSQRLLFIDTETTGLSPRHGDRIIELACLEMVDGEYTHRNFWKYFNPGFDMNPGAIAVHGITDEFLSDKPSFEEFAMDLWRHMEGATLVIHNADFDLGFIDAELGRMGLHWKVEHACKVIDTIKLSRLLDPQLPVSLDILCQRYHVTDPAPGQFQGVLLDAWLLSQVYIGMQARRNERLTAEENDQ